MHDCNTSTILLQCIHDSAVQDPLLVVLLQLFFQLRVCQLGQHLIFQFFPLDCCDGMFPDLRRKANIQNYLYRPEK